MEESDFTDFTKNGCVAQLVEQWTENPCVARSIRAAATKYG